METKKKTFDAVAESRQWREAASHRLDAMPPAQRLAYFKEVGERYRAKIHGRRNTSVLAPS